MRSDPGNQRSNSVVFYGVEELEEAAQALGWHIEYRQLSKGDFRAEFASLECDGISLVSERFQNHLYIPCEPPDGFIGLFLPRFAAGSSIACGHPLTDASVIAFPPSSELEFVNRGEIRNETLFLTEAEFQAAARAVAPSDTLISSRSATILDVDPTRFAAVCHEIDSVFRNGGLNSEIAWNLLAETILFMADASSSSSAERLVNGASAAIAHRAQTFIEERFREAIRMQDLCTFTGVGLRTLQRCFSSHFQVSPIAYIKARRLNAARRDLADADPSSHTVTWIAMENGFSHLGRFSVDYRAYFGESPSETMAAMKVQG
jgi:AraC family ethanolamine operon transcriptional activator